MDFLGALNDLRMGKIDKIEVNAKNFPIFQKAWANFAYQNTVQGIAHRGGEITYVRIK